MVVNHHFLLSPHKNDNMISKKISFIFCIASLVLIFSCSKEEKVCFDTNCADYTSQSAAQSAFNADPECRSDLDADNDGIACEENGNSVTICPITNNCGCSGLNKTPCENNICCKWVVGDGCRCR